MATNPRILPPLIPASSLVSGFVKASGNNLIELGPPSKFYPDPKAAYAEWEAELAVWDADEQFLDLPQAADHLEVTEFLLPQFLNKSADYLIQAGFARALEREALLDRLKKLPEKKWEDIVNLSIDEEFIRPHQYAKALEAVKTVPLDSMPKEFVFALLRANLIGSSQIDELTAKVVTLPREPRLQLNGAEFCWRVKSIESITKKLCESSINQRPARIGDFWAGMIIADGSLNVTRARQVISEDPAKTSQKDYIAVPQPDKHRCFMAHFYVENQELVQTGEIQVIEKRQDLVGKFTHKLKDLSRGLADASRQVIEAFNNAGLVSDKNGQRISSRLKKDADFLEQVRTYANDAVNITNGMNERAIPGFERFPEEPNSRIFTTRARSLVKSAEGYSGLSLKELAVPNAANTSGFSLERTIH